MNSQTFSPSSAQFPGTGSTLRIQALHSLIRSEAPSIDLHRTRCYTRVFQQSEGEPVVRRRYRAIAETIRTMDVPVYENDLLPGWTASTVRGNQIAIEMHAHWLDEELESLPTRASMPFCVFEADKEELRRLHLPYWKNRTLTRLWEKRIDPQEAAFLTSCGVADLRNYLLSSGSHFTPDYPFLMEHGYRGYYELTLRQISALNANDPSDIDRREFLFGMKEVLEAVQCFSERLCAACLAQAQRASTETRRRELLSMAELMRRAPWEPPATFYEALETVWCTFLFLYIEGNAAASCGFGRLDQYLYPFYQRDVEQGRLTKARAMELLEELYLKCSSHPYFQSTAHSVYSAGYYRYPHLDVGGLNEHGQDASNDLSYLCLRAMRHVRTNGPSLCLLLHQKTPDALLYEACKLSAEGMGHPSFFNVDTLYAMLSEKTGGLRGRGPFSLAQIRTRGCAVGCTETSAMGLQYGHCGAATINAAACASLALTGGKKPEHAGGWGAGTQVAPSSGDFCAFSRWEDYKNAVFFHMEDAIRRCHAGLILGEKLVAEQFPVAFFSMLSAGVIERGADVTTGTSFCNAGPTMQLLGLADTANSIAAVRYWAFDQKKYTLSEIFDAVCSNFENAPALRADLRSAPKYGNGDPYVDEIAAELWTHFAECVRALPMWRGNFCDAAIQFVQANVGFGSMTGALPSGRLAGTPTADSMAAEQHTDKNGLLAAARSYGRMDYPLYGNGTTLNLWVNNAELRRPSAKTERAPDPEFPQSTYREPDYQAAGMRNFAGLIRTLLNDYGVYHVQFNTIDKDLLCAAQRRPQDYPTLMVRVAGYSAYWNELSPTLQEDILSRTEHAL